MRATPEQVEQVRAAIAPLDTQEMRDAYRNGQFPRADKVKDLDKRYRWDLVNATGYRTVCDLYDAGMNDTHIDTILRTVVAPLT